MARPKGKPTATIRVTQEGKKRYEKLLKKYEPHYKTAEFLEEVLDGYEKVKMSKKDEK